jgi:hypothetical protein
MAITLNFACNDPDNGNFVGRFDRMDLDAGDLHMEFEGSETSVEFDFPTRGGYGNVTVGEKQTTSLAYKEWYGNWCWNAASFTWVEALEIINYLGATGEWSMTDGPCSLFDAFDKRHAITQTEWKTENEAGRVGCESLDTRTRP